MAQLRYHLEHRHATWLELFFDLVFVASIGVITHHLAHVHDGHLELNQVLQFGFEFIAVWWIWATHTLFANRFDADSRPQRLTSLVIMFLMVTMAGLLGAGVAEETTLFVGAYVVIRCILAGLFFSAGSQSGTRCKRRMGLAVLTGAAIAGASLLLPSPLQQLVFLASIAYEMVASVRIARGRSELPAHREHLVERVGLLSIVLLGESVISLVHGLRGIRWTGASLTAALTGFVLLCAIYWIYFDGFRFLERARQDRHGFVLLYSHVLFLLGLGVLANLIGHAVRGDIGMADFRLLAIGGMTLFYLGKQISYFVAFPPFRINIVINSVVCIAITSAASFLPRPDYALLGLTLGMLVYVGSNYRWTVRKDISSFVEAHAATGEAELAGGV